MSAIDWSAQPELDARSLNSPRPCKHDMNCVYNGEGGCAFVHSGEEGVGRRLFPARTFKNAKGDEIWQNATVRLFGAPGKSVGFYERRRLRLSWPEWCKMKGLPMPIRRAAAAPAVAAVPVAAATAAATAAAEGPVRVFAPAEIIAQLIQFQTNQLGEMLFPLVVTGLDAIKPSLVETGSWSERITAGKITGMFLAQGPEWVKDILGKGELNAQIMQGCAVLNQ